VKTSKVEERNVSMKPSNESQANWTTIDLCHFACINGDSWCRSQTIHFILGRSVPELSRINAL